ncbi:MAG: hypothetical protein L3K08_00390 [Thermoplasmata archaeon]|nr:hypothetical protein [Thermoplasmata archaeon]
MDLARDVKSPAFALGLGVLLMLTGVGASDGTAPHPGIAARSAALPPLLHHGNVSSNLTPMAGTGAPGVGVDVEFSLAAIGGNPTSAGGSVQIPPILAELPVANGSLSMYFRATNVTLNASGGADGTLGPAARFPTGFQLDGNRSGLVSSQGLALMSTGPAGSQSFAVKWRWDLHAPDGSSSGSAWSPTTVVAPDQVVVPALAAGKTWSIGSPYTFCLNGPVGGRTFTLRLAIASPPAVVVLPTAAAPIGSSGFCWNSTLPAGVSAQTASLHLWEVTNTTFLLAAFNVQIVAADPGSAGAFGPASINGLGPWLWLAVAAGVAIIGSELFLLVRSRASPVRAAGPPPPGVFESVRPPPPGPR